MNSIRIGTRGSKLALWQARWVQKQLQQSWPNLAVEIQTIQTTGDQRLDVSLDKIGGKGLFIKEIEDKLLSQEIDIAVHSMKDVTTVLPDGLVINCILEREDPRDALVSRDDLKLVDLPAGACVGTSSLRRLTQLKAKRPDLRYLPVRGNVDTRLAKLQKGEFDAIVLAAAGLKRLDLADHISEYLDTIPAVAQGAIGIERRQDDQAIADFIRPLNHALTSVCVHAERHYLKIMEGNCQVPLGGYAHEINGNIEFSAFVSDLDGQQMINRQVACDASLILEEVGKVAHEILDTGGREILDSLLIPTNKP